MIDSGPVALLVEGEAGIGKTTLWSQGLVSSAARGQRVLRCRPGERETQLAYAALGDLLADVRDAASRDLPAPQRRALEVALLRAEPDGEQSLQRAVGLGLLGVLRALADRRSDAARDRRRPVAGPSVGERTRVRGAAPRRRTPRILLRPSRGRRGRAARTRPRAPRCPLRATGARRPRRRGARAPSAHRSRGAALAAHARARPPRGRRQPLLRARDRQGPRRPRRAAWTRQRSCPIPANLLELVRDRLELMPPGARAAAQVASALSRPTVRVVDAALVARGEPPAAGEAVAAGVLERDGERLAFAHPLLATVAYQLLEPAERRVLHAGWPPCSSDPEERARHLALAADEPDEAVASALTEAARRAAARGAPDAAADLLRAGSPTDTGR